MILPDNTFSTACVAACMYCTTLVAAYVCIVYVCIVAIAARVCLNVCSGQFAGSWNQSDISTVAVHV